jgi:uncharacterized protein YjeT (DUF2065 family)
VIQDILFGLGCIALLEGLVLALAPNRIEQLLEFLREFGPDTLRTMGLLVVAIGVGLIYLARL